jgi:hypothetical protein
MEWVFLAIIVFLCLACFIMWQRQKSILCIVEKEDPDPNSTFVLVTLREMESGEVFQFGEWRSYIANPECLKKSRKIRYYPNIRKVEEA